MYKLSNTFFPVEGANEMLLNCHMCQLSIAEFLSLKNTRNYKKGVYLLEISV